MDPRVSVIIPSYNHAQFVGEAIRSVLNQSYSSIEVLVTDDASQDGSVDVIRAVKDPRVRLEVFPSNRGLSLAMNAAIERAHGEFISVLDSDDYLLPDTIVKQVDFLEKNPHVSAVFGMPKLIDERGIPLNSGYGEFTPPFVGCSPSRQFWLRQFFFHGNCLCHTTVMIRRSVHDEVGLYDPRLWNLQDFDLWVRLCVRHDICVMQDELTARRIRDNNLNLSAPRRDTVLRSMFETFEILKHYRSMAPELIREVFARDLTNIDSNLPASILLGELALTANPAAHRLFGLETLFQEAKNGFDARGLFKLTGCVDAFNIGRCLDTELLHQEARDRLVAEESLHAEQRHRLKMELSQQVEERERLQSELLQQAQERGSLQEELSQRAREYEQLRADLGRQAEERERLQADLLQQAKERETLQGGLSEQARESERLRAELSQQGAERERLRVELSQQTQERENLQEELSRRAREQEQLRAELSQQGLWAATAPLASAVVASGSFVATGQNKQVQHLEGGIIREILVKEGDVVEANQSLIRLDDTPVKSKLRRLVLQRYRLIAASARLEAEIDSSDKLQFPAALAEEERDPIVQSTFEAQEIEFKARRASLLAQEEVFRKEIAGLQESIRGYQSQVSSSHARLALFDEELKAKTSLVDQQLIRKSEVLALRRSEVGLSGELGELLGRIGDARERIARAEQQIVQLRSAAIQKAIEELHRTQSELDDLREQIRAAQDVVERTDVRAPVRGIVIKLNQYTPGGVIAAGGVILELLPVNDEVIIEARVNPNDITYVTEGQHALVRLTGLNQRLTPMIEAKVLYLSADIVSDHSARRTNETDTTKRDSFIVRVQLDERDMLDKIGNFRPSPGMPADVFIETGQRTFFNYLMRPVFDSLSRAFREH